MNKPNLGGFYFAISSKNVFFIISLDIFFLYYHLVKDVENYFFNRYFLLIIVYYKFLKKELLKKVSYFMQSINQSSKILKYKL